ncbi:Csu type fimbrial protein [Azotobacter salinestris]|uniref:Csu type fimbrial protein n=1 Tax=Azotobacter salinestris TaxID=69964 RepID=UPI00142F2439|nr:spore coat U domain-containing protein [Azotobacter salinestris]
MNKKIFSLKVICKATRVVCVILIGGLAITARAEETANLDVSATVIPNCSITTTPLAFGDYDPVVTHASADLDATGTVNITCTQDAPVQITLGEGLNADSGSTGAAPLRQMTNGGDFLSYDLYSNAGRTTVWGDDATVDVESIGTGLEEVHTVYGRIPAGQNVAVGNYADTVVATVIF